METPETRDSSGDLNMALEAVEAVEPVEASIDC